MKYTPSGTTLLGVPPDLEEPNGFLLPVPTVDDDFLATYASTAADGVVNVEGFHLETREAPPNFWVVLSR